MIPVAHCATCGGRHPGRACYRKIGACFLCGSMSHRAKDCTVSRNTGGGGGGSGNGNQQNHTARLFALTANQAVANLSTVSGTLLIGKRDSFVLFDTGLTHSVVSLSFVRYLGVEPSLSYPHMSIANSMGNSVIISDVYRECLIVVGDRNYKDTSKDEPRIEDYPVGMEYEDVFPDELPSLPRHREVEFTIKLIPGAEPISQAPYQMEPLELQELKE
ncbi:uncharacterized protein LOC141665737 [Apium graveolens]|uniref:uncharacterized protein LOC141665737 n=1 Tax=Apium graveolens TaxID=4045 RepID=UPI003D7AE1FA